MGITNHKQRLLGPKGEHIDPPGYASESSGVSGEPEGIRTLSPNHLCWIQFATRRSRPRSESTLLAIDFVGSYVELRAGQQN